MQRYTNTHTRKRTSDKWRQKTRLHSDARIHMLLNPPPLIPAHTHGGWKDHWLHAASNIEMVRAKAACRQPWERIHGNATTNRSRNRCATHVKLLTESDYTLQLVSSELDLPQPHSSAVDWGGYRLLRLWFYVFVCCSKNICTLLLKLQIFWEPIQSSNNLPLLWVTTCGSHGASCHCQAGNSRCWLITAAAENVAIILPHSVKSYFGRRVTCSAYIASTCHSHH